MNNRLKISLLCFLAGSSVFNVKCGRTDGSENNQDEQRVNNMAFESAVRELGNDFDLLKKDALAVQDRINKLEVVGREMAQNALQQQNLTQPFPQYDGPFSINELKTVARIMTSWYGLAGIGFNLIVSGVIVPYLASKINNKN